VRFAAKDDDERIMTGLEHLLGVRLDGVWSLIPRALGVLGGIQDGKGLRME
jgi:hypothetical protein